MKLSHKKRKYRYLDVGPRVTGWQSDSNLHLLVKINIFYNIRKWEVK